MFNCVVYNHEIMCFVIGCEDNNIICDVKLTITMITVMNIVFVNDHDNDNTCVICKLIMNVKIYIFMYIRINCNN